MKGRTDTSGGRLGFAVSDLVPKSIGIRTVQEIKWLAVGIQQQLLELWRKQERKHRQFVSKAWCMTNRTEPSRWSTGSQSADGGRSFTIQQQ